MEPKVPQGEGYTPQSPERGAMPVPLERPYNLPERLVQPSLERSSEQLSHTSSAAMPTPTTAPSLPVPMPSRTSDDTPSIQGDDNPAIAGDDDLIEKEWVDRAKKIISDTREDPHRREVEVNKLQADYLKKRYGKDLGQST